MKTVSLRGFALVALACGLLSPARAQLNRVTAYGGAGATAGSRFGYAVALSSDGTVAITGGPGFNSNGGAAWISTGSGAIFATGVKLTAGSGAAGAGQQGYAVGISGDGKTAIVGAPFDTAGGANAGAFWLYTSSAGTFSEADHVPGATGSQLGASVALSSDGKTALVGAPGSNLAAVYTGLGGSLSLQAVLSVGGTSGFGTSVAISTDGNTALVGAPNTSSNAGGAWVFTRTATAWSSGVQLPLGTPAIAFGRQGMAVSLSANGQRALVGGFTTALGGAAWTYNLFNGVWSQEAQLAFFSTAGADAQGSAVSLSGDGTLAFVGAYNYSGALGAVVEFQRSVNPTSQAASWTFIGGAQGDASGWQCGFSVAVAPVAASTGISGCPGASTTGEVDTLGGPDLAITNVHNGTFSRGASGSYTIHVSNAGSVGTYSGHTVTVIDTLPAGLTYTGFSGSGWACSSAAGNPGTNVTCANTTQIAPGAAFGDLTVNVAVSSSASVVLSTTATVSGGGEVNTGNDSATDLVQFPPIPDLAITISHSGALYRGRLAVPYTINIINVSPSAPTSGQITVTDTLPNPNGLSNAANISAPGGWNCTGGAVLSCSTNNVLAGSTSATITFTADVSPSAATNQKLPNTATVSCACDAITTNNTATDRAAVGASGPDLTIVIQDSSAVSGPFRVGQTATYWISVSNIGSAPTSGTVTVTDTLPAGLTATAMSGTGWSCTVGSLTCTRHDPLPAGLSYKAIALTVSVTSGAGSPVTDTATVSGGGDSLPGNNSAIDVTSILR